MGNGKRYMTNDFFLLLASRSFAFEDFLLSFQPPAITTKTFVFAHNAMTRNYDRDRIRAACTSDSAHRSGISECFGDVAVRHRLSVRNRSQFFPNLTLKGSRP